MTSVFLLINSKKDHKPVLKESLRKIKELIEINETFGVYDFVAKIESPDEERLQEIVVCKIKKLDSVKLVMILKTIKSTSYYSINNTVPQDI
ncbi:MAG: hypothetical protein COA77_07355 [Thaumarchaeota archaeon]|nr:MAG: hypothetical protein COA77_07355 [Nitrososphaerota archaeon]